MVDYSVNLPQLQQAQAPNMLSMAEHLQKMQTSNMLMQQRARELQKENALTEILGRSGGKATPDVIKGLIASGNYEPALALQRHAASMGSIGVNTQAAQTALEESRLKLGETKRTLASSAAARDFITQNEDLTNPDALTRLRQTNPDAYQEIAKFNTAMTKAQSEAAREGRLSEDATLKLFKSTAETFAPLIASSDEQSFYPLYDRLAKLSEPFAKSVPREFTPQNVSNIVKIAEDLKNAKYETVGGVPGIVDMRSGTFKPLGLGGAGTNAMLNQQATTTPSASPARAAAAQPATPQTMEQFLAAADVRKAEQVGAETTAREIAQSSVKTTQEEAIKKQNAAQILKLVADPELENIVKQSTSGLLETGGALARGAFGTATPGMTNINRLETFQSKILLDFVNGKLGGGFSNEDRKVVEKMAGRIADPLVPANSRLATLRDLKSMLESAASGEQMKIGPAAGSAAAPAQPRPTTNGRSTTPSRPPLSSFGGG
jgi:hypothetical protein